MYEFFTQVKNILERLGIKDVEVNQWYKDRITVAGIYYYAQQKRSKTQIVWVDSKRFDMRKDASLLVAYIIETLPVRLAAKKKRDEERQKEEEVRQISRVIEDNGMSIYSHDDKYTLSITHTDKQTLLAAADFLVDSGFTEPSKRSMEDQIFILNKIRKMYHLLDEEGREQLKQDLEDGNFI